MYSPDLNVSNRLKFLQKFILSEDTNFDDYFYVFFWAFVNALLVCVKIYELVNKKRWRSMQRMSQQWDSTCYATIVKWFTFSFVYVYVINCDRCEFSELVVRCLRSYLMPDAIRSAHRIQRQTIRCKWNEDIAARFSFGRKNAKVFHSISFLDFIFNLGLEKYIVKSLRVSYRIFTISSLFIFLLQVNLFDIYITLNSYI